MVANTQKVAEPLSPAAAAVDIHTAINTELVRNTEGLPMEEQGADV